MPRRDSRHSNFSFRRFDVLLCQDGCADGAGMAPELCRDDRRQVFMKCPSLAMQVMRHAINKKRAGLAHASTQDDPARIERVLDRDARDAEVETRLIPNT